MKVYRLALLGLLVGGCAVSITPAQVASLPSAQPEMPAATAAGTSAATTEPTTMAPSRRPFYAKDSGLGGKFSIYGKIAGDGKVATVTIKKAEAGVRAVTLTTIDGEFESTGLTNGDYLVTPSLTNRTFKPDAVSVTIDASNPRASLSFQEQ